MILSLTCPRCGALVTADDEDKLVTRVQLHVRVDHGGPHSPSRDHILARLHHQVPPTRLRPSREG